MNPIEAQAALDSMAEARRELARSGPQYPLWRHAAFAAVMATLVLGACGAGVFPAVNMLGAQIFGVSALARVIGLFTLCTLPMNFLLPPAAGVLRDHSVNYNPVIVAIIAVLAVIMALFLVTARAVASRRTAPEAAPA